MVHDPECEPWNNGYQLAANVEELLERLRAGPMSRDDVERACLGQDEIGELLDSEEAAAWEEETLAALVEFSKSAGQSVAFAEVLDGQEARAEEIRRSLEWNALPDELRARCVRRADTILDSARERGFAVQAESGSWTITPDGKSFLDAGGDVFK